MTVMAKIQSFLSQKSSLLGPLALFLILLAIGAAGKGYFIEVALLFRETVAVSTAYIPADGEECRITR